MNERTIGRRRVFEGRLVKLDVLDVELDDGRRAVREIVAHPGGVVALARRADGCFVLVRQFRKPLERELTEVVAGTLEPGEDPAACAVREVHEETGYGVAALRKLGVIFPAPGYTSEQLHIFLADLAPQAGAGAPDEDECVETVVLTADELVARMRSGAIGDAKTLAAWWLYTQGAPTAGPGA